jgi:hypothetical protein
LAAEAGRPVSVGRMVALRERRELILNYFRAKKTISRGAELESTRDFF